MSSDSILVRRGDADVLHEAVRAEHTAARHLAVAQVRAGHRLR